MGFVFSSITGFQKGPVLAVIIAGKIVLSKLKAPVTKTSRFELKRTKPYGYSLFNIDAFCNVAQILSTPEDNLFEHETKDGKSLKKGLEFIYPYIQDKSNWPYDKDIYIWNEWPVCHPALLFGALAYSNSKYLDTYLELPAYPIDSEVVRNLPVRHPIIWLIK